MRLPPRAGGAPRCSRRSSPSAQLKGMMQLLYDSGGMRRKGSHPVPPEARWLLLIHQIPPTPAYLRVKIGRHLQRIGAVAIKNSVYVLPRNDETQEDFQWVLREVVKGGGDASILEARFIDGLSDAQVL